VKAVSRANVPDASQSLSYFVVSSPHISNVSLGQSVGPGNRFFFFDTADALSVTNEWAIDTNTGLLSILLEAGVTPADVVVASTATIVQLAGRVVDGRPQQTQDYVRHVTLRGLGFTSTSYTAQGFQSGFNVVPGQGLPDDAAVRVSGATDVSIVGCHFAQLSGGGVHAFNGTSSLSVLNSTLHSVGQSAVLFTGNNTSQVNGAVVAFNDISDVGVVLAAAGGIVVTSGSNLHIHHNNLSDLSRWGVAVRSNGAVAMSRHNIVEWNRVHRAGLRTRVSLS